MKLNYKLFKILLETVEEKFDHPNSRNIFNEYNINELAPNYSNNEVFYHVDLLKQAGFIKGDVNGYSVGALTLQGHQVLDAMRNDTIWNRVKSSMVKAGISGIEQIPALALSLLLSLANSN